MFHKFKLPPFLSTSFKTFNQKGQQVKILNSVIFDKIFIFIIYNFLQLRNKTLYAITIIRNKLYFNRILNYYFQLRNSNISYQQQSHTKERISSFKTQTKENKTKEIQIQLDYFKNVLDQIMDFKNTVENTFEKFIVKKKPKFIQFKSKITFIRMCINLAELLRCSQIIL
ncbi:unnamed protein product [Paramecium octaurelia]|uniref:Uncharacterized protein n=1 Tax=Paramecium octaurelia TaxID=43137 RepID=A0A8S1W6N2_PAROT|nr:unnamed protein product [Paramecium octaurelia]CAD8184613.1 unnamed protein product [Paramecium octaurelia]